MGGFNVNRKRFLVSGSFGFGMLVVLLAVLITTGSVSAAIPITGFGGFEVKAERIYGENFELVPTFSDTNGEGTDPETLYPAAQNYLERATIDGLQLKKVLDISKVMPGKKVEIIITSGDGVTGEGVFMYVTSMLADSASFTTLEMDENMIAQQPAYIKDPVTGNKERVTPETGAEIGQKAATMELTNATITCTYMANDKITIPGMNLELNLID